MNGRLLSIGMSFLLAGVLASPALCQTVGIAIAPSTINLNSQTECVTVHADIPYNVVVGESVTLDGLPATGTFADDCGDLVAKFDVAKVKALLADRLGDEKEATVSMTLDGTTTLGSPFSGTDTVRVVNVGGKRK